MLLNRHPYLIFLYRPVDVLEPQHKFIFSFNSGKLLLKIEYHSSILLCEVMLTSISLDRFAAGIMRSPYK